MEINIKKIQLWSSKKETYYTYYDKSFGEIKIIITEYSNHNGEQTEPPQIKLLKDNYCIPDLVKEVFKIHHSSPNLNIPKVKE